jgi:hypothetical protein
MSQIKDRVISLVLAPVLAPVAWIISSNAVLGSNFHNIQFDRLPILTASKIQANLCKEPPPYCPQTVSTNQNIIISLNRQGIEPPPNQLKPIQTQEPPPSQTT